MERLEELVFFEADWLGAEEDIRAWLLEPLVVGARSIRYRFPNQRARRIAKMRKSVACLASRDLTSSELRLELQAIEGIGPKTAAWIIRNCFGSDDVAIIDVHLIRACQQMKLFPRSFSLPRDYAVLEEKFLAFAAAIDVRPSVLDAVMWTEARRSPGLLRAR